MWLDVLTVKNIAARPLCLQSSGRSCYWLVRFNAGFLLIGAWQLYAYAALSEWIWLRLPKLLLLQHCSILFGRGTKRSNFVLPSSKQQRSPTYFHCALFFSFFSIMWWALDPTFEHLIRHGYLEWALVNIPWRIRLVPAALTYELVWTGGRSVLVRLQHSGGSGSSSKRKRG